MSRSEFEGSHVEALDAGEDLVGRLVPPERLGVFVDRIDILGDRLLQLDGRSVNPAPDLLLRQIGEEVLDLVEPRRGRRGEVNMPARTPGDTGIVVPPRDNQALATAWKRLHGEGREGRAVRGEATRRHVADRCADYYD